MQQRTKKDRRHVRVPAAIKRWKYRIHMYRLVKKNFKKEEIIPLLDRLICRFVRIANKT